MKGKTIYILDWIYIIGAILLLIKGEYEMGMLVLLISDIMNIKYKLDKIYNKLKQSSNEVI